MKNEWLKNKNFISLKSGYGVNLTFGDFIENEVMNQCVFMEGNSVTYTPTEFTPIVPGSLTGTVKKNDKNIQTFYITVNGYFATIVFDKSEPHMVDATLNHTTGELVGYWNVPIENTNIIVNYEYNYE